MQIKAESREPIGAAIPIGNSVSANSFEAKYAPGIRTSTIEAKLWMKEIEDFPYPQKYPLKQKCIPASMQSKEYDLRYWQPAIITASSLVNNRTSVCGINWQYTETIIPKTTVINNAYLRVFCARFGAPAPIFCAVIAETEESIADGTRKRNPIIFSTIPTAAAAIKPRPLAIIVIIRNDI